MILRGRKVRAENEKPVYVIQDRQAGNKIVWLDTLEEAEDCLRSFEEEDRKEGTYEEDFYEIVEE